ncbi:hypothetical protein [Engelhardtia mirabilis]|uniref:Uncharacterized protein n=1 Tax=Engelhardtia mirabilis TaxID=2528011 RepID=A0A518BL53_9BACT|nr:hypothetical protein Pla133_27920 [Planctomycetes bacterium Pla133]QDV02030.1 hypothetical protein Pla86_27910 [Planctomycetes bacterium Pla86]
MASVFRKAGARVPARGIPGWARVVGRNRPATVIPDRGRLSLPIALLDGKGPTFPASAFEIPDPSALYSLGVSKAGGGSTTWSSERGTGDIAVQLAEGGLGSWPAAGTAPNLTITIALAGGGSHSWPLSVA